MISKIALFALQFFNKFFFLILMDAMIWFRYDGFFS